MLWVYTVGNKPYPVGYIYCGCILWTHQVYHLGNDCTKSVERDKKSMNPTPHTCTTASLMLKVTQVVRYFGLYCGEQGFAEIIFHLHRCFDANLIDKYGVVMKINVSINYTN